MAFSLSHDFNMAIMLALTMAIAAVRLCFDCMAFASRSWLTCGKEKGRPEAPQNFCEI
jgi:hypothetical protein